MTHIWKSILCLVLSAHWSSLSFAGSVEDYETGSKAFTSGNIVDAMTSLRRAADNGHAAAQALLAYILDAAELNEESVTYYRKSAEQGNAEGEFGLGSMYATGEGITKNLDEARRWITLAAKHNSHNAIAFLADNYISGGLGLDEAALHGPEALFWIRSAADNNHLKALIALSAAYSSGQYGLTIDPEMVASLDARIRKLKDTENNEHVNDKDKTTKK